MLEIIWPIITIVFCWLAIFFYGMEYGSGKRKFFYYGIICLIIGETQFVIKLLTGEDIFIFASTLEGNAILIIISVVYLATAFVTGYIIGRRIKAKEKKESDKNVPNKNHIKNMNIEDERGKENV